MVAAESNSLHRLVFLEDHAQVVWVKNSLPLDGQTRLVALTADALQSLEEHGLPHEVVSTYADTRELAKVDEQINLETYALAREIEEFVAEQHPQARFDGPGFLSGQGYWIQYLASAILTRSFLIRETISACSPRAISLFGGSNMISNSDRILLGGGNPQKPWIDIVKELAEERGTRFEMVPFVTPKLRPALLRDLRQFPWRAYRYARRRVSELVLSLSTPRLEARTIGHMRLLMGDSPSYDWAPVLAALRPLGRIECVGARGAYLDKRVWTFHYTQSVRRILGKSEYHGLALQSLSVDEGEAQKISEVFDRWLRERPTPPELRILGMNIFPPLAPFLRSMSMIGPALVRHADDTARRLLDTIQPNIVCFWAMPWLATHRLAYHSRQRGIPVLCYQHGGCYGTHVLPKNEQMESAHADFFLTYGLGIRAREKSTFPVRAKYVAVGSARVAAIIGRRARRFRSADEVRRVLWIGEISTQNLWGGTFQLEDTKRYLLQRRCLQILSASGSMRVTYRPYPTQDRWDGITRWIQQAKPSRLRVDTWRPLEDLIWRNDLVITDASSSTVWNESIAMKKPLILFCDPEQTTLLPHFAVDLERACHWCKTEESLIADLRRLAEETRAFLAELRGNDAAAFLRKYVLHDEEKNPVARVVSFLSDMVHKRGLARARGDSPSRSEKP